MRFSRALRESYTFFVRPLSLYSLLHYIAHIDSDVNVCLKMVYTRYNIVKYNVLNKHTWRLHIYVSGDYCSGSLEPESSCHDRDWIMELPMEADILTITGILTPEGASVAPCFPFDITISLSWFPLLCLHYIPLYHRGRETSSWFWAVTLLTLKIKMYPDGYRICNLGVTIGGYRTTAR